MRSAKIQKKLELLLHTDVCHVTVQCDCLVSISSLFGYKSTTFVAIGLCKNEKEGLNRLSSRAKSKDERGLNKESRPHQSRKDNMRSAKIEKKLELLLLHTDVCHVTVQSLSLSHLLYVNSQNKKGLNNES